jgi:phospholipase/carboxylesterase
MTHGEELVARWRCGSRENARGALILLLHDHGGDEDAAFALAALLPAEPAIAALRGPLRAPGGGYRWFETGPTGRQAAASLTASMDAVERWIDDRAGDAEELWLAGFGQGAVLAEAVLLRTPQRYAGAALLHAGGPLHTGLPVEPNRRRGLEIFHGTATPNADELHRLVAWFAARTTTSPLTITGEHR